jgi:hypothetical protein
MACIWLVEATKPIVGGRDVEALRSTRRSALLRATKEERTVALVGQGR